MNKTIKQIIRQFINQNSGSFTLDDILNYVAERELSCPIVDMERYLETNPSLFFDLENDLFLTRKSFFMGSVFLISPTAFEINNGILIPGHRFLPFYNSNLHPSELKVGFNGKWLRRKRFATSIQKIIIYFTLFGLEQLPHLLLFDESSNELALMAEDPNAYDVELSVWNMASFYEEAAFKLGDYLLAELEDWETGRFRITPSAKSKHSDQRVVKNWIKQLDTGFAKVFEYLGLPAQIENQLAYAFYFGGRFLLENPCIHLGAYLKKTKHTEISTLGSQHCFWKKDEDVISDFYAHTNTEYMVGVTSSLDSILTDIGLTMTEDDVEAYMLDELYHNRSEIKNVYTRIFFGIDVSFYDDLQRKKFEEYVSKAWRSTKRNYNIFKDQIAGRIRSRALKLFEKHLKWIRTFDARGLDPMSFPQEDMISLSQASGQLSLLIKALNQEQEINRETEEMMEATLDHFEYIFYELMKSIDEDLQPPLMLIKKEADNLVAWYTLKIALKGIKPKIWREFSVPGDLTLAELHRVIQIVMGWEVQHAHYFKIKGKRYAGADWKDAANVLDEDGFRLMDLIRESGLGFDYAYDMHDRWQHVLKVESIDAVPDLPQERKPAILCSDGKRACPPEDCGGVEGYQNIMHALKNPDLKEHREMLSWVGEYDPESFSILKVNDKLAKIRPKGID